MKGISFFTAVLLWASACSQVCHCEGSQQRIFSFHTLNLCGSLMDSTDSGMLANRFTLCNKDSVLMNHVKEAAGIFLFQPVPNGINMVSVDVHMEKGKLVYPKNFATTTVRLLRGQLIRSEDETPAAAMVSYLQNNFKKFRELY